MSNREDKAGRIVALARRLGFALTESDLEFALYMDDHGRQPLVDATVDLPIDLKPAVEFLPRKATDDL